jgi:hypothetical protein
MNFSKQRFVLRGESVRMPLTSRPEKGNIVSSFGEPVTLFSADA